MKRILNSTTEYIIQKEKENHKKTFSTPKLNIIKFTTKDIITTSSQLPQPPPTDTQKINEDGGIELPFIPAE